MEDELELLDSYLFSHLNNIILRGVTPTEGFYVPESSVGNLNENQILQLFKNSHFKYMMYQAVFELVKDTDLGQKLKLMEYELGSNNINWLTKSTLNTRLQELELEGKISSEQRISALQLYVEWYVKFLDWSVLGVTRLSVDENGEFTNIPLTLDEIQFEILNLFVFEN